MLTLGYKNWIETDITKIFPEGKKYFSMSFNPVGKIKKLKFQDAADYTANVISSNYENLHLCLSGGMDSEFVATVLLRNSIKFKPVIVCLPMNQPESWYAFKFCHDNQIEPTILNFTDLENYDKFLKIILDLSLKINVPPDISLVPNAVAKIIEGSKIITGYGDPFSVPDLYSEILGETLELEKHDFYLDLESPNSHPSAFFTFTPEIFKALIFDIDKNSNVQVAKSKLYNIPFRSKIYSVLHQNAYSKDLLSLVEKKVVSMNNKKQKTILCREQLSKIL